MNKLFILLLSIITINIYGQQLQVRPHQLNLAPLYIDTLNSRVGVGTSSPATLLHVVKEFPETTDTVIQILDFGSAVNRKILFGVANNATAYIQPSQSVDVTQYRDLTLTPKGGNVGIGTSSPTAKLEISTTGADGLVLSKDPANLLASARLFFINDSVGKGTTILNLNNDLLFNTLSTPGSSSGTERMRITSGGNVLVGTTTDNGARLQVSEGDVTVRKNSSLTNAEANLGFYNTFINTNSTNGTGAAIGLGSNSNSGITIYGQLVNSSTNEHLLGFQTRNSSGSSNTKMVITGSGNVGIGTKTPAYQLELSTNSAAKPTSSSWTVTSDSRVKKNITPYNKGLNVVLQLNPIEYDYNGLGGYTEGYGGIGIIAQEVKPILPEAISSFKRKLNPNDEFDTELLNFDAHPLPFIFINAFKEQQAIIEQQQRQINELLQRIIVLENK